MVDKRPKRPERQDLGGKDAVEKGGSANTESTSNETPDPSQVLATLIEAERTELMYVHSILRMLYEVLLYSDDDDGTMHADVARTCSMLIRESMERLEVLVRRYKAGEFQTSAGAQRPAEGA
ncbi:hypothetical protein [Steroidobacter agaridevorans]|uniref:hypothetical protein n=1 Tax=Steroidobacter agaridevorans TaxID=2695856 RepID=UPI001327FB14|nr:hypothetical protein [Steroidobacter agaridevorans]GFE87316.1 hypothetical protein GCM10011488_22700 [Steroidobacter agaridevorans]